ncbi:MAG TPA: pyridoxamine 5'-phosphate oxidase family protein, partial [Mycobacterium sp.]
MTGFDAAESFAAAQVAVLATVDADSVPHVVPVVFALSGGVVYTAVDAKRKTTRRLRRLANIAANPRVSML